MRKATSLDPWSLRLLGKMELRDSKKNLVPLTAKNIFVLLAFLAEAKKEPVSRDMLAEIVWESGSPKSRRDSLRNAIVTLRKCLPANALEISKDFVILNPNFISADWLEIESYEDYTGDFMAGLQQEWVLDRRIQIRNEACENALRKAQSLWENEQFTGALALANRACQIDPLNEEAALQRVNYLNLSGNREHAFAAADAHRSRILRHLGAVSDVRPETPPEESHPLLVAAEWLLDRNPEETLSMLAATHLQWLTMPVEAARDFHFRSLEVNPKDSVERRLVYAQHVYLTAMAGSIGEIPSDAERAMQEAFQLGEPMVAARMAGALSYANLSKGVFDKSLSFAKQAMEFAKLTKCQLTHYEFETQYAIILIHCGKVGAAEAIHKKHQQESVNYTNTTQIAQQTMSRIEPLLALGKIDLAAKNAAKARKIFEANNASRMLPWISLCESLIHEAVGDYYQARISLEEIQKIGSSVGGQAVTAMTADKLASVNCRLGEYGDAAESLVHSALYRKSRGTVPSVIERKSILVTHGILLEKLGQKQLQRTYLDIKSVSQE